VEKSAPQIVGHRRVKLHPNDQDETEIKDVNYGSFVYLLINSVKELYARLLLLEEKQKQIDQLKKENTEIKQYICSKDHLAPFCTK
jgi:hypothetical protein